MSAMAVPGVLACSWREGLLGLVTAQQMPYGLSVGMPGSLISLSLSRK